MLQNIQYQFVPNVDIPFLLILRGEIIFGRLDAEGVFHQVARYGPSAMNYQQHGGIFLNSNKLAGRIVYEYRSNALIPGTFNREGYFVPEVGGTTIRFQDYRYSPSATHIWNIPGYFYPVYVPQGGPIPIAALAGGAFAFAPKYLPDSTEHWSTWPGPPPPSLEPQFTPQWGARSGHPPPAQTVKC